MFSKEDKEEEEEVVFFLNSCLEEGGSGWSEGGGEEWMEMTDKGKQESAREGKRRDKSWSDDRRQTSVRILSSLVLSFS